SRGGGCGRVHRRSARPVRRRDAACPPRQGPAGDRKVPEGRRGTASLTGASMREPERDTLIRSVTGRIDLTGEDGAVAAHAPAAAREAEELLMRHLATPDGTDPEVQYTVGVLYLLRAVTPPAGGTEAPDASHELVLALTLLAPFYQNPPGTPDILPSAIR